LLDYLVTLPSISIEAHSEAEAYGLVMMWLTTTLGIFPLSNGSIIGPIKVTELKTKSIPKISAENKFN